MPIPKSQDWFASALAEDLGGVSPMTEKGTIRGARRASGRGDRTRRTTLDMSLTEPGLGIQ